MKRNKLLGGKSGRGDGDTVFCGARTLAICRGTCSSRGVDTGRQLSCTSAVIHCKGRFLYHTHSGGKVEATGTWDGSFFTGLVVSFPPTAGTGAELNGGFLVKMNSGGQLILDSDMVLKDNSYNRFSTSASGYGGGVYTYSGTFIKYNENEPVVVDDKSVTAAGGAIDGLDQGFIPDLAGRSTQPAIPWS